MNFKYKKTGYTLTELLIALIIMALLLLAAIPVTISWSNSNSAIESKDLLQQGYAKSRVLALSNPTSVKDGTAAAYLCFSNSRIYVQPINQATCGTGFNWSANIKPGTTLTVAGATFSCIGFSNIGIIVSLTVGSNACTTSKSIIATKGGQTDERSLY